MSYNMIADYEVDRLVSKRESFLLLKKREYAYTYTRLIFMYASRLLFAIGWNILRDKSGTEGDAKVYENIFIRSGNIRKNDSIEPGKYAFILRSLAKAQKNNDEWLKRLISVLTEMGECRNRHMHPITDIGFNSFFAESECIIQKFSELFETKKCEYLIPCETKNEIGEIKAYCLRPRESIHEVISIRVNQWEKPEQKLFYRVRDNDTGKVELYCLSPFVSCGTAELFLHGYSFWAYQYVQNAKFSDGNYDLYYTKMQPSLLEEKLSEDGTVSAHFEGETQNFRLSDLFVNSISKAEKGKDIWYQSHYNSSVRINISSYPDFDAILNNTYSYCDEICSIRSEVLQYCKNKYQQLLYICGNGGVGKTALILSILNQFYTTMEIDPYIKKPVYGYTNLIFFTAKHKFFTLSTSSALVSDAEADISSYDDFLHKLSVLLDVPFDNSNDANNRERLLLEQFERYKSKDRFLLIIDDLDSMDNGGQSKLEAFITQMNPEVVKTIVTTRFLYDPSPSCLRISELTEKQSVEYARWVYRHNYGESWNTWTKSKTAESIIAKGGKGNPLRIKILIAWVREGLEDNLDAPASKQEMDAYFFNTVQNILDDHQKQLLEIVRRIYSAFPTEYQGNEVNVSLLRYLSAGVDMDDEEFQRAFKRLQELKLLYQTTKHRLKLYDSFITNRKLLETGNVNIPSMYKYIFKQIKNSPTDWLDSYGIEETVYKCIIRAKEENESRYVGDVAMKIFECMIQSEYISRSMYEKVNEWIRINSINTKGENVTVRLIETVENDWAELREIYSRGANDEETKARLDRNMLLLSQMQLTEDIKTRLFAVILDKQQYS